MGHKTMAILAVCVVACVCLIAVGFLEELRQAQEVLTTRLFPNAQQEFEYGERHFDASNPKAYNVGLAEYFFQRAAMHDTSISYLYHEIARIDFLKGNFDLALTEITLQIGKQGDKTPNSYYIRGLIEGYMGDYVSAAKDYERFLKFDPYNWAGINDYAWVLLKANRNSEAFLATSKGLEKYPDNPWLLNSNAIALYEMGYLKESKVQAAKALEMTKKVTVDDWLHAYPGNDPKIAEKGVATFKKATEDNMHTIISSTSTHALQ